MRKTISNLSRQTKVSRPTIYYAMERLGIAKCGAKAEFEQDDWERLHGEISAIAARKNKAAPIKGGSDSISAKIGLGLRLNDIESSTLRERLQNAKREYDHNLLLIEQFQSETKAFINEHGSTSMKLSNGAMAAIPAVSNLDKYSKLNIALSKLINSLEQDLDLEIDGGGESIFA
ncbi:MAG: hypothetical protein FWB71_03455 [Defluviitaleaceae bacterium]|nr:hypothetical protein [Defluviitaleaceae bacterium]